MILSRSPSSLSGSSIAFAASHPPRRVRAAFTLVELLAVIAIIGVLTALVVPAATSIAKSGQLTSASQILIDQVNLARQRAQVNNREVEVRFYRFGDSGVPGENPATVATGQYRALQLFEVRDDGTIKALDKIRRLPNDTVMVRGARSSILDPATVTAQSAATSDPMLPGGVNRNYEYVAIRFRPDSSTSLASGSKWFITVQSLNQAAAAASNFFTLQIDPINGATKTYRPSV